MKRALILFASVTLAGSVVGCAIPRFIAPVPTGAPAPTGIVPRFRRGDDSTATGEAKKSAVKQVIDALGNCAPMWCSADSIPGKPRCVCVTTPPTALPN